MSKDEMLADLIDDLEGHLDYYITGYNDDEFDAHYCITQYVLPVLRQIKEELEDRKNA